MWTNNGPLTPQLSVNSFNSGRTQFCGLSTFVNAYAIRGGTTQFTSKMYAIKSHITRLLSMIHSCSSSRRACHFFFLSSLSPKTSLFVSKPSLNCSSRSTDGATARSNQNYLLNALLHLTAAFAASFQYTSSGARAMRGSGAVSLVRSTVSLSSRPWGARGIVPRVAPVARDPFCARVRFLIYSTYTTELYSSTVQKERADTNERTNHERNSI